MKRIINNARYDLKDTSNIFSHLTNYSVNKKSPDFQRNKDDSQDDYGNKWSLSALKKYLEREGIDQKPLWDAVEDVIIKTLISVEDRINAKTKQLCRHRYIYFHFWILTKFRNSCFEIYGFDILIDDNLKPHLIEVNILPSLSCSSPLDKKIKTTMLANAFHIIGIIPYDRSNYAEEKK